MSWLAIRALLGRVPVWAWFLAVALAWGGIGRLQLRSLRAEIATERKAQADKIAELMAQALATESTWKGKAHELHRAREIEVGNIAAALDAAERRLRDRPARRADLPEAARAACAGSTGAELSGEDGRFLAGEAARANQLRAALAECQGWIEAVRAGQR